MNNRETYYNLTHPQKRVWYTEKIYSGYPLNNIGGSLKINGIVDFNVLNKAINEVIKNNDGLRLQIIEKEGEPHQYVADYKEQKIDYYDFSHYKNPKDEYKNWTNNVFKEPFEFENNSLCYFAMYKISGNECGFLLKIHHIITDGWSIYNLIQKQVCEAYTETLNLKDITHSKNYSYIDYINKENKYIESDKFKNNKKYWLDKLRNIPEESLYTSSENPKGKRLSFNIDMNKSIELRKYLNNMKYSLNEFFTAVLMIYLSKTMGSEDITIGLPILNRAGVKDKNTIGMFTSTMPLRLKLNSELTINEFIDHIRLEFRQNFRNQKYPYNLMMNDLEIAKKGFDSLFRISLNYYNVNKPEDIGKIATEFEEGYSGYQSYSLQIIIKEWSHNDSITLNFDYRVCDYSHEYISNIYKFFHNIINQIVMNNKKQIKTIKLLTPEEVNSRIYAINSTKVYYPQDKSIYELFEEQVIKTPDKIALINGEEKLTYKEVNEKSNRIASYLREKGIESGKIVGIIGTHSFELIIGILGVLKAGGAYLPIDSNYPVGRINYMLNDSKTSILLTNIEIDSEIEFNGETVDLKNESIYTESKENLNKISGQHDLAYIIYTSGSTGKPKGVMINHRSLLNYIWWAKETYIKKDEIFAFYSSIAFDLTVTSIYTPLISGSTIAVYHDDGDEFVLNKILRENKATVVKLTPSHLSLIKDIDNRDSSIRRFIVGGENLKTSLAKDIHESFGGDVEILNEYGPTEATVGCMIYKYSPEIDKGISVPIGKSVSNTQIYVLDKYLNVLPEGIEGEMYISGDCLARGYLNEDRMTNERFIDNPFIVGQAMYKTGDMAKYLKDGNIEYCGRKDNQVKIRGHRIELGEIEGWLLKNEKIKDVVVAIKEKGKEDKLICTYIISNEDTTEGELKNWLSKFMPKYMIPAIFIFLDEFPLTSNGKVDVQSLLDIDIDVKQEFVSCRNEIEKILVETMKQILMVDSISINDNFYRLGGDSIKAIQISSKLKDKGYSIKLKDILSNDTIEEIAASIEISNTKDEAYQGLCKGEIAKTPIIEWFISKKINNINHWNQSVLLKLNQNISIEVIKQGIEKIIEHHDILRLNYDQDRDKLFYNDEHLNKDFSLYCYDISDYSYEKQSNKIKELGYKIKSSFDIEKDLLLKACVFRLGKEDQMILITAHHLMVDGVSWRIIVEDFTNIVKQLIDNQEVSLPLKTHSYKKWSETLLEYSKETIIEEKEFWQEIDKIERSLPIDHDLGEDLLKYSDTVYREVDERLIIEFSRNINEIYSMELNEGLIVALVLTINKFTNQTDIVIEMEHHGREDINKDIDISRTVGWFTSIYPTYFDVNHNELQSNIKSLKEQQRNIPNKGFNYGALKYLKKELEGEHRKYIRFNYLGDFDSSINNELFKVSNLNSGLDIGENNELTSILDINVMIINKKLNISITYSKNMYKNNTVEKFINMYIEQIEEILNHCLKKDDIELTVSDFDGVDISQDDLDSLFM